MKSLDQISRDEAARTFTETQSGYRRGLRFAIGVICTHCRAGHEPDARDKDGQWHVLGVIEGHVAHEVVCPAAALWLELRLMRPA